MGISNSIYSVVKRLIDIHVSLLALLLLLPVFVLLSVSICIDSPGRPFFVQKRVGRGGCIFKMLKFRSMIEGADRYGPNSTADNDPRITRVGHFIRRSSLDELPQLWNVLVGHMSLIGPRPDLPAQEALYSPYKWKRRCKVRPGITGLAQVSGRSNLTVQRRLTYDLLYAARPTFRRDFVIAIRTVWVVINKTGVN